ncbi:MAG TPA: ACT domain-containing protein [Longimicrobiales bacterium]|nr:ACT domain-containing protein [Longimicrobiales bacterium]
MEDRSDNQTRFLVVQRDGAPRAQWPVAGGEHAGAMRTTLLVATPNEPGALVRVLTPFADRGINLSKLESRPTGEPWTYRFFMELDADLGSADAEAALRAVQETGAAVRSLGSYPRWCQR